MSKFKLSLADLRQGTVVELSTTEHHIIKIPSPRVRIFEVEDSNFHFASAVFLPTGLELIRGERRSTISTLETVAKVLLHANDVKEPLCVAGHTDTVGGDGANAILSEHRAQNAMAFLRGDRDAWVSSCEHHVEEDVQHILTWCAYAHGYGCDPKGIDGDIGSNTRRALKAFRRAHGEHTGTSLPGGDDDFAEEDWDAIFDLYESTLAVLLNTQVSELSSLRNGIAWHAAPLVACGEAWPQVGRGQDELRSPSNRRVDFVFLESGDFSSLDSDEPPGLSLYGSRTKRIFVPMEPILRPLRVKLLDGNRSPLGAVSYTLEVAGSTCSGRSGDDGLVEHEVPSGALFGDLTVVLDEERDLRWQWKLALGPLPPPRLDVGAQGRLSHLGIQSESAPSGHVNLDQVALATYQRFRADLDETGEFDDDTLSELEKDYDDLLSCA